MQNKSHHHDTAKSPLSHKNSSAFPVLVRCTTRSRAKRHEDSRIQGVDDAILVKVSCIKRTRSGSVERDRNYIEIIHINNPIDVQVATDGIWYRKRHSCRDTTIGYVKYRAWLASPNCSCDSSGDCG